jgi:diacylglycerol kinase (ATP)
MRLFIVNPTSGNGRGREVWSYVKKELEWLRIPYRAAFTARSGHAREIASQALSQPDLQAIIAIGGDGTVHEVGNSLVGTPLPLGYIPAGTGNDFGIAHRIPFDPILALERVLQHQIRRVDTADIGERKMISFMGIGFDATVAEAVNRSAWKQWLGRLTYAFVALQTLRSFYPTNITLRVDGQSFLYDKVWFMAITNIANYAGGMKICPDAIDDDGQLDICCVRNMTPRQFLRIFPSVYKGKHIHHPSVTLHRGREITIQSHTDTPLIIHSDGEIIGKTPLSVKVCPQSLFVL